jgi:xanthine dehydrogenase YagR molybdenum-binding subunit
MAGTLTSAIGAPTARLDGREKVTGEARYAFEHPVQGVAYGWIVQSRAARGAVRGIDAGAALAVPGVLGMLSHENAPALQKVPDGELAVLQSSAIAYRGQIVAVLIAETLEAAREAARLIVVHETVEPHDVRLRRDHPRLYRPEKVNPGFPTDTEQGDVDAALRSAAVVSDHVYTTPAFHNNPMEPHAALAIWEGGHLTLYDSSQGAPMARDTVANVLGLPVERVRIISQHVGGGFGSKGTPRPHAILAALAAKHVERPVKIASRRRWRRA